VPHVPCSRIATSLVWRNQELLPHTTSSAMAKKLSILSQQRAHAKSDHKKSSTSITILPANLDQEKFHNGKFIFADDRE
jgi:hypothetical protein